MSVVFLLAGLSLLVVALSVLLRKRLHVCAKLTSTSVCQPKRLRAKVISYGSDILPSQTPSAQVLTVPQSVYRNDGTVATLHKPASKLAEQDLPEHFRPAVHKGRRVTSSLRTQRLAAQVAANVHARVRDGMPLDILEGAECSSQRATMNRILTHWIGVHCAAADASEARAVVARNVAAKRSPLVGGGNMLPKVQHSTPTERHFAKVATRSARLDERLSSRPHHLKPLSQSKKLFPTPKQYLKPCTLSIEDGARALPNRMLPPGRESRFEMLSAALEREEAERYQQLESGYPPHNVDHEGEPMAFSEIPQSESEVDPQAKLWLKENGLGQYVGLLGTLGTCVEDFAELTSEDAIPNQIYALARRTLGMNM